MNYSVTGSCVHLANDVWNSGTMTITDADYLLDLRQSRKTSTCTSMLLEACYCKVQIRRHRSMLRALSHYCS